MIALHPEIGKNTTVNGIKAKVFSHYWILYRVLYNEIELVTIWDNRRNPDRLNEIINF